MTRSASPVDDAVDFVLGIDTSAYTTSISLLTVHGELLAERRRVLDVPPGRRGLRQSEAVFQHVNNLADLFEEDVGAWSEGRLVAVAASTSPRSHPDSYMPVFRVGASFARALAVSHGASFVPVSHQDGHVWAGLWSADSPVHWADVDDLVVMHASGGTTELFRATRRRDVARWDVHVLSTSEDLYAGQFVDRAGVRLGLPFPAGPHLERLAADGDPAVAPLPVAVEGSRLSFSGPDTAAMRLAERGVPPSHIAAAVEQCVAESLARWAGNVITAESSSASVPMFLGVGGVMANQRLRAALHEKLSTIGIQCMFASPRFSVDNAVGTALAASVYSSA